MGVNGLPMMSMNSALTPRRALDARPPSSSETARSDKWSRYALYYRYGMEAVSIVSDLEPASAGRPI
jgi:hypothetical protein